MRVNFYHFNIDEREYHNNLSQLSQAFVELKSFFGVNLDAKLIVFDNIGSKDLSDFIKNENADINIFCDDILSNKFAIKAAAYLDVNVLTRIENFTYTDKLTLSKITYQGNLIQKFTLPDKYGIITLSKTFPQDESLSINEVRSEIFGKSFVTRRYQTYESIIKNLDSDIENSKIVFIGGKGLGSMENFDRLRTLASRLGAQCACTRSAAMHDFDSYDNVVGSCGNILNADLCITFGVNGDWTLMYGLKNVKKIIAINADKNAFIFKFADEGIIEDCVTAITQLENIL